MALYKLPGKFLFILLLPLCLAALERQEVNAPFETELLLHKQGFSLGYSHTYRQALWVSYTLTAEHLQAPQQKRRDKFKADPEIKRNAVRPRDYTGTGFDKGHLAPAADMTYSMQSMNSSFLMSNISPQYPGCNRGIWKRLETQVRKWALKEKKIRIITGPVFSGSPAVAGKANIPVPVAFYKVILDLT
ncbi:MAG: DNA/RNA non-specific endonuclease, partial [Lentisphaeria bacterium]|nr:DNA/RNA non-specific endonuclease [Lentisphaeria bacterium]